MNTPSTTSTDPAPPALEAAGHGADHHAPGRRLTAAVLPGLLPPFATAACAVMWGLIGLPLWLGSTLLAAAAAAWLVPSGWREARLWLARLCVAAAALAGGWLCLKAAGACVDYLVQASRAAEATIPAAASLLAAGLAWWWAALGTAALGAAGLGLARAGFGGAWAGFGGARALWLALLAALLPLTILTVWLADRSGLFAWTA